MPGMILWNLQIARFQRNMKQEHLAKKSGVAISTISRIENGKCTSKSETAFKLAKALNYEVWQLASSEGSDLDERSGIKN